MKPSRLVTSGGVRHHTGRGMKKITKAALVRTAAALAVAGAALAATTGIAHADSGAPSVTYVHWVGADCIAVATAASDPTLATTRSVCGGMWRWSRATSGPATCLVLTRSWVTPRGSSAGYRATGAWSGQTRRLPGTAPMSPV